MTFEVHDLKIDILLLLNIKHDLLAKPMISYFFELFTLIASFPIVYFNSLVFSQAFVAKSK